MTRNVHNSEREREREREGHQKRQSLERISLTADWNIIVLNWLSISTTLTISSPRICILGRVQLSSRARSFIYDFFGGEGQLEHLETVAATGGSTNWRVTMMTCRCRYLTEDKRLGLIVSKRVVMASSNYAPPTS